MAKSRDTLLQEINDSVRSAGQGGKTTAQDMRQVLGSLVEEILARPGGEPVGTVKLYAGATPPADWAICDGRQLPIAQYPALHAVVGTSYGGDGTTTFALPDLRGRVALGAYASNAHPLGQTGGADSLKLTVDQLPAHNHQMRVGGEPVETNPANHYFGRPTTESYSEDPPSQNLAADAITSTGSGAAIPNLPPFATLHYIICLRPASADAAGSVLEFVFEAEFADAVVRTMGQYQAGEYRTQELQNVATVAYKLNDETVTLPFAVNAGDTLAISITRNSANQTALVSLRN